MSQQNPVSRPKVPWRGPDGVQKGPATQEEAIKRVAVVVLILTNPTAAVFTAAAGIILTRRPVIRRLSGWIVAAVGVVLFAALSAAGAGRSYVAPWRDVIERGRAMIEAAAQDGDAAVIPVQLWDLVRERWLDWTLGQAPIAAAVAMTLAGVWVAWRRQRYRATWREAEETQPWEPPSKRRVAKAHRRVDAPAKRKRAAKITADTPFADLVMLIGATPQGVPAPLTGAQLLSHMVTTGPSGYGKTTTLLRIMQGWLVLWEPKRLPLVLFDFKGDPELRRATAAMAAETGRAHHVVSVTGHSSTTYNPLRHGSSEEVASRLMETLANAEGGGFESPHHRSVGERWLILSVVVLDALVATGEPRDGRQSSQPWRRTLGDLVRLMPPTAMAKQAPRLSGEAADRAGQLLSELEADKDLARSILGMTQRVALMNETAAGRVMRHGEEGLDLLDVIHRGDVVVFSLDSQANSAAARAVGNLAVADLSAIMGQLQEERWAKRTDRRVMVMLDEFTGLGGGLLQGFLERARGAGGSLVVSTQTDGGFTAVSPEFAESVWGNSNVWLMHRQTGESASSRAEDLGTESGWAETLQVTEDTDALGSTTGGSGVGSLRRVERFRVHPNELKSLEPGQVLFVSFYPRHTERVQITKTRDWAALAPDDEGAQEPETAELQPAEHAEKKATAAPAPAAVAAAPKPAPRADDDEDFWGDDDAATGSGWTHETDW